jgi:hypothetical protein
MSVHKIREQFNQMLLKIGLIPEPKKYIPIIKPKDEKVPPCSEKD